MPSLQQLESLVAVADNLSFQKAGEALGLAQPTVSRNVKLLEEEFGRPFFDRSSRTATLNAEGRDLVTRSRRILHLRNNIDRFLAGSSSPRTRRVLLGVPELVAATWLPAWARLVEAHLPACKLSVVVAETHRLPQLLASREIQLAVAHDLPASCKATRIALPPLKQLRFTSALREASVPAAKDDGTAQSLLVGQICAAIVGLGDVTLPKEIDPRWLRRCHLQAVRSTPAGKPVRYEIAYLTANASALVEDIAQLGRQACDFRRWMSLPSWLHGGPA